MAKQVISEVPHLTCLWEAPGVYRNS